MRGSPIIRLFVLAIAWFAAALPGARAQAPMPDMPPALAIFSVAGDEAAILAVAGAVVDLGRTLGYATRSTLEADADGGGDGGGRPGLIAAYRFNVTVLGVVTRAGAGSSLRIEVHDGPVRAMRSEVQDWRDGLAALVARRDDVAMRALDPPAPGARARQAFAPLVVIDIGTRPEDMPAVLGAILAFGLRGGLAAVPAASVVNGLLFEMYTVDMAVVAAAGGPSGLVVMVGDGAARASDDTVAWVVGLERHLAAAPIGGFDIRPVQ